jgi:hypothetical protein
VVQPYTSYYNCITVYCKVWDLGNFTLYTTYYGSGNFGLEYGRNYGSITIGHTGIPALRVPQVSADQLRRVSVQFLS